ncbi:MAG: hypothetical protein ABFS34_16325 [Gemmatimonadota bacterium]
MDDHERKAGAEGTLPVRVACGCGTRRLPLRVIPGPASDLRQAAGGTISPDTPVMTYRCRVCKEVVVLRAGDLHFVDVHSDDIAGSTRTS